MAIVISFSAYFLKIKLNSLFFFFFDYRTKLVNAERASLHHPWLAAFIKKTRRGQLDDILTVLLKKYLLFLLYCCYLSFNIVKTVCTIIIHN